jgi:5-methylcytosine-specific restriction endonuclease McrA
MSQDIIPLMLFVAQEGRCFHCQEEFIGKGSNFATEEHRKWTRDHVKLACKGHGRATNTVLACGTCNHKRGNRPATDAEMARAEDIFQKVGIIWGSFYGTEKPIWPDTKGNSVLSGVTVQP